MLSWNCVVWICPNKSTKINLHVKSPTFKTYAKLKVVFTVVYLVYLQNKWSERNCRCCCKFICMPVVRWSVYNKVLNCWCWFKCFEVHLSFGLKLDLGSVVSFSLNRSERQTPNAILIMSTCNYYPSSMMRVDISGIARNSQWKGFRIGGGCSSWC